ncbi:MAG TPA: aldo/keto reductase [bacterium]|nr:aldo/keto reductase [bacterium]HPR87357.1 aldo/keto reductase [bacterium]
MIYHPYGSTGIELSAIGFGGMRFLNQNDVEACASLIKKAYDLGITYFDTAIGYGRSEELFGVAFQEMKKQRRDKPFYVATKTNKADPGEIRRELETSLTRMGLDQVDFYHVWCVMDKASFQKRQHKGALQAFEQLQREGLIRHICVSSHMTGTEIEWMLEAYPFAGILLGYSVMNYAYRDLGISAAARLGRGVVIMNPLGGGIIPQHPGLFDFVRTRPDESVVQGALRFLLHDPRITTALVGFSTEAQIEEAVAATADPGGLTAEEVQGIRSHLSASFDALCTGCGYCDHCPEGIPVPRMMDSYNQYMLSGKPEHIAERLGWHWGISRKSPIFGLCSECGQCEEACTQKLPIRERLKEIRRMVQPPK